MKKITAGLLFGFCVLAQLSVFACECVDDKGCSCSKPKPPVKTEEEVKKTVKVEKANTGETKAPRESK